MCSQDFDTYECELTNDQLMMHAIALKNDIVLPPNYFSYNPGSKLTSVTFCYFSFFTEIDDIRIYEKSALKFINKLHEIDLYINGSMSLELFGNLRVIMQSGESKNLLTFIHVDKFAWLPESGNAKTLLIKENFDRVREIFCREPQYLTVTADVCNIWSKAYLIGAAPQILDINYYGVANRPVQCHGISHRCEEGDCVETPSNSETGVQMVHLYRLKATAYTEKIDMEKFGYSTEKDKKRRRADGDPVISRVSKLRSLMLKIIDELHRVGIVHGNLSPETILADKNQKDVRIVGWENARWVDPKTIDEEAHALTKADRKAIKSMFAIEDVEY